MENTIEISTFFLIFILFAIHTVCVVYIVNRINNTEPNSEVQDKWGLLLLIDITLISMLLTWVMI